MRFELAKSGRFGLNLMELPVSAGDTELGLGKPAKTR
jgi:hypothetical protein